MDKKITKLMLNAQKAEITEYHIYNKLASSIKIKKNKEILTHIANDELRHYKFWKTHTKQEVEPNWIKVWMYFFISKLFGITFGLKLMERGEDMAQKNYKYLAKHVPNVEKIEKDEHQHENELLEMLEEKKLDYVGSMVLGLNDALVELTGAIAGLTLAFQNTRIVGVAGLVTGIAASLSMAASEYLSTKAEGNIKNAKQASFYTGIAYIVAVLILITPYFTLTNHFHALAGTLILAILIILVFTFYMSVAKELDFKSKFWEMTLISLGVATLSFFIGLAANYYLGVEI